MSSFVASSRSFGGASPQRRGRPKPGRDPTGRKEQIDFRALAVGGDAALEGFVDGSEDNHDVIVGVGTAGSLRAAAEETDVVDPRVTTTKLRNHLLDRTLPPYPSTRVCTHALGPGSPALLASEGEGCSLRVAGRPLDASRKPALRREKRHERQPSMLVVKSIRQAGWGSSSASRNRRRDSSESAASFSRTTASPPSRCTAAISST